ncbi:Crp/Fnr family transcriptional regulator [Methylobacterium sp. E-045]|uniref:Crp/Fnr family transcriptional regulator n=1 Tax=Methylobacterium sp. E-045 TaxID=2836575 RepID=UPI001FBA4051|nr:Crp/Fnr family transcriptional regulator [Methylobacterium sp. E-045]MCJ2127506.1 Crp/Fnr family transcriptional regulator [Methylobacterium sp. E-045]
MSIDICALCPVREHALCSCLNDEERIVLNGLSQRRRVMAGETVMWAGDESRICANLQSGVLKVVAATTDGREQIVSLVYPADFVGEPYATEIAFTVTALSDAELCTFPRLLFERFLEEHARMGNLLLQRTLGALKDARARMLTLARLSAGEKVAGLLLDMAVRAGRHSYRPDQSEPVTFDLPMTRGHMADVLGMTIETVSRQLTKLKSAEVVVLSGARTITIVDGNALKKRAMAA